MLVAEQVLLGEHAFFFEVGECFFSGFEDFGCGCIEKPGFNPVVRDWNVMVLISCQRRLRVTKRDASSADVAGLGITEMETVLVICLLPGMLWSPNSSEV